MSPGGARALATRARIALASDLGIMRITGLILLGCVSCGAPVGPASSAGDPALARSRMVEEQIAARGVRDPEVLRAMSVVPRDEFVPAGVRNDAYLDQPLGIGHGQTISQPYIVALMTELAAVKPGDRVLEIGTGSGYQAAILAELGARVHSIEIVEPLARSAAETLRRLGYDRVEVRHGDGYRGWPEAAPFAAIVATAAPPDVPPALLAQLAPRRRAGARGAAGGEGV